MNQKQQTNPKSAGRTNYPDTDIKKGKDNTEIEEMDENEDELEEELQSNQQKKQNKQQGQEKKQQNPANPQHADPRRQENIFQQRNPKKDQRNDQDLNRGIRR
jgi:hypothetical protein